MNGHHGLTTYSSMVLSISLFNILLCFPSLIDISVILFLLASCSLPCSAVLSYLPFLYPFCCLLVVTLSLCQGGTKVVVWRSVSPPLPILILLAPLPMPMPAPAQVLTGWHCANLPPLSFSFVAHPSVALPPVSTFQSLSLLLIPFIQFLNNFLSVCKILHLFIYLQHYIYKF